ncbi:MAG: hypothetical protein NVS3B18_04250 [Candidatus Dormibacteria bacterium]
MGASPHTLTEGTSVGAPRAIGRGPALALIATGLLFLVGAIIHPHAPQARDMAEVAYIQTGQGAWWPAHLFLLASYALFAAFLLSMSRRRGLTSASRLILKFALPIACFSVLAMFIHLLLPIGRDSVADSHRGWALWAKDFAEAAEGLWALCVAMAAWQLGRAGIVGNRLTGLLGLGGGIGFALFSFFVPLTGVVVSMQFIRLLLQVVPVTAILIAAWALVAGVLALSKAEMGHRTQPAPKGSAAMPQAPES